MRRNADYVGDDTLHRWPGAVNDRLRGRQAIAVKTGEFVERVAALFQRAFDVGFVPVLRGWLILVVKSRVHDWHDKYGLTTMQLLFKGRPGIIARDTPFEVTTRFS